MASEHEIQSDPAYGAGALRAFHVTATVYLPRGVALPTLAEEWFAMVDRMGSSLHSVTEIRYPLCDDVVAVRRERGSSPLYS